MTVPEFSDSMRNGDKGLFGISHLTGDKEAILDFIMGVWDCLFKVIIKGVFGIAY